MQAEIITVWMGTVRESCSGRGLKEMNIMYLLILKLYEPDFIMMIPYYIKPLESSLSPAVLGKSNYFLSALFISDPLLICHSPHISWY